MVQQGNSPTHQRGNTLDLVMTFADRPPTTVIVQPPGAIIDYSLIISQLPVKIDSPSPIEWIVRGWRRVDRDQLREVLQSSQLCAAVRPDVDVDQLFHTYSTSLHDIADQLAPSHVIRRRAGRPMPWFDAECRAQRHHCRHEERHYRRTCRK